MAKGVKTGGRTKGTLNRYTTELKDMVFGALNADEGGEAWLKSQKSENPVAFMTLLGKFVPRDLNIGGQDDNPIKTEHRVIFDVINGNLPSKAD